MLESAQASEKDELGNSYFSCQNEVVLKKYVVVSALGDSPAENQGFMSASGPTWLRCLVWGIMNKHMHHCRRCYGSINRISCRQIQFWSNDDYRIVQCHGAHKFSYPTPPRPGTLQLEWEHRLRVRRCVEFDK